MSLEIQKKSAADFKKVYFRYCKDFPPVARRSYQRVIGTIKEGYSELLFMKEGYQIIGYAIVNVSSNYNHMILDYIAVHKNYRNLGYGEKFIQMIFEFYSDKDGVLGEVEIPELGETDAVKKLRTRRFQFYKRLGFQHIKNVHLNLWEEDYHLVYYPLKKELSDTKELVKVLFDLYENFYNDGYHSTTNVQDYVRIIEK